MEREEMEILKTLTDVTEKLYREGKIDDRKIFSYATALSLPNGNYGMVGIGFNHDKCSFLFYLKL